MVSLTLDGNSTKVSLHLSTAPGIGGDAVDDQSAGSSDTLNP
jgi:hypothetical protein